MGMGIPLEVEAAYWAGSAESRDNSQDIADVKKTYKRLVHDFTKTGDLERLETLGGALLSGGQWSQLETRDIIDTTYKNARKEDSLASKEIKKMMDQIVKGSGRVLPSLALSGLAGEGTAQLGAQPEKEQDKEEE